MKITILGKEYNLKATLRAMIIFEKITKKTFDVTTFTDQLIYFYSLILANNPGTDNTLSLDDLISACDDDPTILKSFTDFLLAEKEKDELLNSDNNSEEGKKKD